MRCVSDEKREGMRLEQVAIMCERKPHHHKRNYSMSTGVVRPQVSGLLRSTNGDLPGSLLSPF